MKFLRVVKGCSVCERLQNYDIRSELHITVVQKCTDYHNTDWQHQGREELEASTALEG